MKKIITIILTLTLFIGGLNAAAITDNQDNETFLETTDSMMVSDLRLTTIDDFVQISLPEQTTYLLQEGKPMLPMITKTYTFPLGSTIGNINVDIERKEEQIPKLIQPSPMAIPSSLESTNTITDQKMDPGVYESNVIYPESSYSIKKGIGIKDDERVIFVNIRCYTQYQAESHIVHVPESIDINIEYMLPSETTTINDAYDLLIIAPEAFEEQLQPLIEHKNSVGMKTMLKTVEDIYQDYSGVADWEEVKLFIKDAIEMYDIKYVLLAGGHKGQTDEWWVPEFRSKNYDDNGIEDMDLTYSSDLYFADIYKSGSGGNNIFDDWDTNDDGEYAEGPYYGFGGFDKPDFYPDVYLGRIPMRYSWEVPIAVNKIIDYETNADDSWFNKAVFCGGDTSPYERYGDIVVEGIYEGELTCDKHAGYLEEKGFNPIKLYTSTGTRDVYDVASVISEGCGWVNMQMHASPATGGNHITDKEDFARFYSFLQMDEFKNDGKLPFMVNDGCHNAQFDVSMQDVFSNGGFEGIHFSHYEWIPTDASSWFVLKEGGGAIGLIGNTALGYGYLNEYWEMGLGGWIMPRFAHAYAIQGREYTGSIWAQGITDYVNNFPVINDIVDRKTIDERCLLGDPSIKLGGYGLGSRDDPDEDDDPSPQLGTTEVPIWEEDMSWTYKINDLDIDFSEIEGRDIDLHFETGNIKLTVTQDLSSTYTTVVSTENLEVFMDIDVDFFSEEMPPIKVTAKLMDTSIDGEIIFDKSTLGIDDINLVISGSLDTETLLKNVDFEVPSIVLQLMPEIPITVDLETEFDDSYQLIDYPLSVDKGWGLSEGAITVDGTVESKYFKILSIIAKLASIVGIDLLPPEILAYLPIVDIGDILNDMMESNEIDIPELESVFDTEMFLVRDTESVSVDAGIFDCYNIQIFLGGANMFYSPEVRNIVKLEANIDEYIPIIDNISLELVETTVE